jgi:hypothetical protein
MASIASIVNTITNKLESARTPANVLPPILLKCSSLTRPGLSAYKIATEVIQNNQKLGIPTGNNPDGSENLINAYTYNIVKSIIEAIKNDAAVSVAVPMGSMLIKADGANGGGPVTCFGTNLLDSLSRGIIQ